MQFLSILLSYISSVCSVAPIRCTERDLIANQEGANTANRRLDELVGRGLVVDSTTIIQSILTRRLVVAQKQRALLTKKFFVQNHLPTAPIAADRFVNAERTCNDADLSAVLAVIDLRE